MMIRLLNFSCFALTALACLALYHVSEETRVARAELRKTETQIAEQQEALKVLQADWERVSEPTRIQQLAAAKLGLGDTPTVALASLELLPRRGASKNLVTAASADAPAHVADARLQNASLHTGE
jgi:cell division protein FtsL